MTTVFFSIPATGHVNPSLGVVRELVARGEPVVYYNAPSFAAQVQATGAQFRSYPLNAENFVTGQAGNPFVAAAQILAVAEHVLPQLHAEVGAMRPTRIIYDSMAPWGNYLAQLHQVPAICSCSIFVVNRRNVAQVMRHPRTAVSLLAGLPDIVRGQMAYRASAQRLQKQWGVTSPHPIDFFSHPGDTTLVYNSRFFQTGAEAFDHTFEFVGAVVTHRPAALDIPEAFLAGGPLVYVSLGTLFNNRPEFFRTVLRAFAGTNYRVVVSLGHHIRPEDLGTCPPNVWLRAYNPQLPLLERAAVFITHGGMNSAAEGAWFGVPMLVVPQMGDQIVVAQRLQQLGAAKWVEARLTPQALLAVVNALMASPTYRAQSAAIGQSLREAGGPARAADLILNPVRHDPRH